MHNYLFSIFLLMPAQGFCGNVKPSTPSPKANAMLPDLKGNEFALYDDSSSKYVVLQITEFESVKFSKCSTKNSKPNCMAYSALTAGVSSESKFNGSPASQLCSDLKGKNLIAYDSRKKEFNFCEFEDGSLANSWELFYKRNPKVFIK